MDSQEKSTLAALIKIKNSGGKINASQLTKKQEESLLKLSHLHSNFYFRKIGKGYEFSSDIDLLNALIKNLSSAS